MAIRSTILYISSGVHGSSRMAQLRTAQRPLTTAQQAPPLGVAGDAVKGGWAEPRRIATAVVGPWETDPTLVHYAQFDSGVVKGPGAVDFRLGSPIGDALKGHNVIAGFSSAQDRHQPL